MLREHIEETNDRKCEMYELKHHLSDAEKTISDLQEKLFKSEEKNNFLIEKCKQLGRLNGTL